MPSKTVVEEGSFLRASPEACCTQSTDGFFIFGSRREFFLRLLFEMGPPNNALTNEKKLMPHIHERPRVMESIH